MKKYLEVKRSECPICNSKNLYTMGIDQMCCDCDWNNFELLVNMGQMDNLSRAFQQHFGSKPEETLDVQNKFKTQNKGGAKMPVTKNQTQNQIYNKSINKENN